MKSGNFAAFYDYTDNGNVEQAQFYNPDPNFDLPATHRHYRQGFTYDRLDRLKSADYGPGPDSSSDLFDVTGLDYDAAGNIKTLQRRDDSGSLIDDLSYSYSGSNRLQSVSDAAGQPYDWDAASATFGYDANGNLISQTGKFSDIAYDHRNLPVHFYMDGGDEVVAGYNADGQRILKESSGGAWSFYVTDGLQTLAVVTEQGLSHINLVGSGTFGRIMADGSGNITTSNTRYYHLNDHLGSTRAVVNNSGALVETFDYYPFGLLMPKRNTASAETREKFTGHEYDDEAGLDIYYMIARGYDPVLGRFMQIDPHADSYPGLTPYGYAGNNPLLYIDPDGRDFFRHDETGAVIWRDSREETFDYDDHTYVNIGDTYQQSFEGVDLIHFQTENEDGSLALHSFEMLENPTGGDIRNDPAGGGNFGDSRDGGTRSHTGIDILSTPGQDVVAPFDGNVTTSGSGGVRAETTTQSGATLVTYYVYTTNTANGSVTKGQTVGTANNMTVRYPNAPQMRNHVHVRLDINGVRVNPAPFFFRRN